jgi:hypothetical protein
MMFLFTVPSVIGTIVLLTVPTNDRTRSGLLYVPSLPYVPALMHPSFSFYLMQSFGAQNPMITGMLLSRNVAGQTKKTYAYAITFLGWAGGNAIAPRASSFSFFIARRSRTTQKSSKPSGLLATSTPSGSTSRSVRRPSLNPPVLIATPFPTDCTFIVTLVFTRALLMRRNAVKDRAQAEKGGANEHLHAFEDLTDLQNPDFRCVFSPLFFSTPESIFVFMCLTAVAGTRTNKTFMTVHDR